MDLPNLNLLCVSDRSWIRGEIAGPAGFVVNFGWRSTDPNGTRYFSFLYFFLCM